MKTDTRDTIREEIPIFFTTDDQYVPFLDVAISSLIHNASREIGRASCRERV